MHRMFRTIAATAAAALLVTLAPVAAHADGHAGRATTGCYNDLVQTVRLPSGCAPYVVDSTEASHVQLGMTKWQAQQILGLRGERVYLLDRKLLKVYPGAHVPLFINYLQQTDGRWRVVRLTWDV